MNLKSAIETLRTELRKFTTQKQAFADYKLADGTVIRLPQQNVAALLAVLRLLGGKAAEPASEDRHA